MIKAKTTRRALFLSFMSMFLCFTMLIGTTYAWFTDTVTSGVNQIVAGNLDVELHNGLNATAPKVTDSTTDLFKDIALWEPGAAVYENFTVANHGTLALKYRFEVKMSKAADGSDSFAEALKVGVVEDGIPEGTSREDAIKKVTTWMPFADFFEEGSLLATTTATPTTDTYGVVVYWEPSDKDNNFNMNNTNAGKELKVDITVNLFATQLEAENDSFGNDYDEGLTPGYTNVADKGALLTAMSNNENVALIADIDMTGWTTLESFSGKLLGNGHKLYNLTGENGLVEELKGATVKDLTIEGAIVGTSLWTGLLAGRTVKGTDNYISNVTVDGTVESNSYYAGGLIGADSSASTVIENCVNNADVTSSTLFAGGIVGYTKRTAVINNAINKGDITGAGFVGGIVGFAACNDAAEDAGENDPSLYLTVNKSINLGAVDATGTTYPASAGGIIGAIGREGGKTPTQLCNTYVNDCAVLAGQNVYGMTVNMNGADPTGNVGVIVDGTGTVAAATSGTELNNAIASGADTIFLAGDVQYETPINNDANIDLAGNTFEATGTINLGNNADLTMKGGSYKVNGTYGHIDARPSSAEGSVLVFEDIDFSFNKKGPTYGPSTNRLGTVLEVCATATDAKTVVVFKNCTFDNAQVLFEGLSGTVGEFEATFENCTFNALTSSAPIYVQNYVKGTINVKNCTFNLECTSSTASAISVSSSNSTSVTIVAENNTINAVVATPYTYDPAAGETEVDNVKVNGTPAGIKFISYYANTTVTETNTVKTGIAG